MQLPLTPAATLALLVTLLDLVGCSGRGDRRAVPPEEPRPPGADGGADGGLGILPGQPLEEQVCRTAVERFARIRGLSLEQGERRQLTLWCLDGPPALATCMAESKVARDVERCESLVEEGGGFGSAAETLAARASPLECDTAIRNLVRLVPETTRDRAAFLSSCLAGSRAQMVCVARAVRANDLSRCP